MLALLKINLFGEQLWNMLRCVSVLDMNRKSLVLWSNEHA